MAVAHHALVAVFGLEVRMLGEKARHLGLDGLCEQRTRAVAQNVGELIAECSWLN